MPHRNTTHKEAQFESYPYTKAGRFSRFSCALRDPKQLGFANKMKPLTAEIQDVGTLQDLGRASVQIVHDLKNQLNGLKLYATFLRKRMEKSERPEDERETVAKLIAGLERAASDMTTLVRYGRPIELRAQPVALSKILSSLRNANETEAAIQLEMEDAALEGNFDVAALTEAFEAITAGALKMRLSDGPVSIHLRRDERDDASHALIEWRDIQPNEHDVFRSFNGSDALRLSLAARIIEAHQGTAEQQANMLRVRLPIKNSDE
jgi:signal transduction histidine kinase